MDEQNVIFSFSDWLVATFPALSLAENELFLISDRRMEFYFITETEMMDLGTLCLWFLMTVMWFS